MLVIVMAAALASAGQFDLICTVKFNLIAEGQLRISKTETQHYRIDLDKKLWCTDDCYNIGKIFRISPKVIDLDFNMKGPEKSHVFVDRMTGEINGYIEDERHSQTNWRGTCERAAFTPLAKPKF